MPLIRVDMIEGRTQTRSSAAGATHRTLVSVFKIPVSVPNYS